MLHAWVFKSRISHASCTLRVAYLTNRNSRLCHAVAFRGTTSYDPLYRKLGDRQHGSRESQAEEDGVAMAPALLSQACSH